MMRSRPMRSRVAVPARARVRITIASFLGVLAPAAAFAQSGPAPVPGAIPAPGAAPPAPGSTYVPTPTGTSGFTYGPNTSSPSGTIGGGNATESSSHPVTGDEEDTFDFGKSHGGSGTVHGDDNSPIFIGGGPAGGEAPYSHIVRNGDTLWGICGMYFENPYQWPRVWSYNPQIKNPHWIYPGDEVRLRNQNASTGILPPIVPLPYQQQTLVDRRRQVPSGTVFLRDQGWIR